MVTLEARSASYLKRILSPGYQFCYGAFAAMLAVKYLPQVVYVGSWPIPVLVIAAYVIGAVINVLATRKEERKPA